MIRSLGSPARSASSDVRAASFPLCRSRARSRNRWRTRSRVRSRVRSDTACRLALSFRFCLNLVTSFSCPWVDYLGIRRSRRWKGGGGQPIHVQRHFPGSPIWLYHQNLRILSLDFSLDLWFQGVQARSPEMDAICVVREAEDRRKDSRVLPASQRLEERQGRCRCV